MLRRAIGDVRPSQIITTFGPGAIIDLQTTSVIVAGIDRWPIDEETVIHEPRLERALRVNRFFPAKPSEGSFFNKWGTVPAYVFPRYQLCPVCKTLSCLGEGHVEYDAKWQEMMCKAPGCEGRSKRRVATLPAPFVVACPGGHIDDFPWRHYVHKGPTSCRKRMKLFSVSWTGSVADIRVHCECAKVRSASEAFGELRSAALGHCTQRRPWLGINNRDTQACAHATAVRAMQRGATNGWFPVVRSALAVKEAATPIGIALNACNPNQIAKVDSADKLKTLVEMGMFPSMEPFPILDIWSAIQKQRGEIETDDIDLRWPEWLAFRDTTFPPSDKSEFFLESGQVPSVFEKEIARVVLARKLLEVRALVGFTRVDSAGAGTDDGVTTTIAPISRKRQD